MTFKFKCSAVDFDLYEDQIIDVLNKRIELYSRHRLPIIWIFTDLLSRGKKHEKALTIKRRDRIRKIGLIAYVLGGLSIVLGIAGTPSFLFVLGGVLLIFTGLLLRASLRNNRRMKKEAQGVIESMKTSTYTKFGLEISINEAGLYSGDKKIMAYDDMHQVMVTQAFIFFIGEKHMISVFKADISDGDIKICLNGLEEKLQGRYYNLIY